MRIAVDARELVGKATGVGRYLNELLIQWSNLPDARRHEWRLYAHAAPSVPEQFASSVDVIAGAGGTRWEQWSLARALATVRPDVLFAPGYTAPLSAPCPVALTIHDVSFFARPHWFSAREGARRRQLTAWSARRAAVVLTDSEFSRDEIVRHIGIPAEKVRMVPPGVGRRDTTPTHTIREPWILFVGSIFHRRHVDLLISAFGEIVAPRVPHSRLDIVGENRTFPPLNVEALVAALPPDARNRISLRSYVDDDVLADLYRRATVFAFPSEYEGFGFTPLEALAAGMPSVVLDTPIAREVYGPAARYVDANHLTSHALGEAIADLLTNEPARAEIMNHAGEVLARYDWARAAAATLACLEEAAGV
jgi:glycosyltransferase involved in cell wall biosynthesis